MNGRRNVGRALGHAAVVLVILAVIAAAFAISYDPVRDIAREAGVQSWLIRIYPGVLDAVFLVACACALLLRGARWWNRLYAWFAVLVTGVLIGAADVYHATGLHLPRRTMDGTVWALPWALVLLGFSLWLTTLQRNKPSSQDAGETPAADAPVLILEGADATRAALPAPGANGGLADVGFGQQAAQAQPDEVPAPIERAATDVESRVAAGADPAETLKAEPTPEPHEPAESQLPVVPAEVREPAPAPEPAPTAAPASHTATASDTAGAHGSAEADEATETGEPEASEPAGVSEPTGADEVAGADEPAAEASGVTEASEPAEVDGGPGVEPVAETNGVAEAHAPEQPEWPFEAEEPAEARRTAEADRSVSPTDDDTPPYGFPAVSEQDVHDEAARLPTLLGAPVPADMETELPADQTEQPIPFERVRSTPTRPEN